MPIENGGVHVNGEAARLGRPDRRYGAIKYALLRHRLIVVILKAIEVHGEEQIRRRLELVEFLLQEKGVGAQRHEFLARHDPPDNGADVFVDERFAARDRHHGGAALIYRSQALFNREPPIEDRLRVVDLAATSAGEIASEERLEHKHQRVAFAAKQLLLEQIGRNLHFLEERYLHSRLFPKKQLVPLPAGAAGNDLD